MKLFDQVQDPKPKLGDVVRITTEEDSLQTESQTIDSQISEFNNHVSAFNSLNVVDDQISKENFNFIDKGNYVLYNEYIKSITSNLNIKTIPIVSQEAIQSLDGTVLNHQLALEGFIADMWAKIKEIFKKIYSSIQEFFKKYFTRLGRLKSKLANIQKVLSETDKDLMKPNLDKVPGGIASKFPFEGTLTSSVIVDILTTTSVLVNSLEEINKKAEEFISKDIVDKDLITNVKKLKEDIGNNSNQMKNNEGSKKAGTFFDKAKFGDEGKYNKNLDNENKSLEQDSKDKSKEIDKASDNVKGITGGESNVDDVDAKGEEAKKQFSAFVRTLEVVLGKAKDKKLAGGKVITKVTANEESGIEIETDQNKDAPSSVALEDKATLLKIIKTAIELLDKAEKITNTYGKVNDKVMESLNTVDKLIGDLDKIGEDPNMGKYKKVLQNKVKVRLNLVKTFFNNYNKVCKNFFELSAEVCDGVVEYSVLSLKNFG